jgi:hypothetical protein
VKTAADLRFLLLGGVEAVSIALQHHLTGVLRCRHVGAKATRPGYRSLKMSYAWLVDEGEITADPMAKMKPPAIPEQSIPVVPDEALRRLFAAFAGKDFEARRDTAMVMVLLDSGARRAELVGLHMDDLDFEHDVARVIGKGRRERALPFAQNGRCPGPLPPGQVEARACGVPVALARADGTPHRHRAGEDGLVPRPPSRHRGPPCSPAAPHVRPRRARQGGLETDLMRIGRPTL